MSNHTILSRSKIETINSENQDTGWIKCIRSQLIPKSVKWVSRFRHRDHRVTCQSIHEGFSVCLKPVHCYSRETTIFWEKTACIKVEVDTVSWLEEFFVILCLVIRDERFILWWSSAWVEVFRRFDPLEWLRFVRAGRLKCRHLLRYGDLNRRWCLLIRVMISNLGRWFIDWLLVSTISHRSVGIVRFNCGVPHYYIISICCLKGVGCRALQNSVDEVKILL